MYPFYRKSGVKVNPNDQVGGGAFGTVYGCFSDTEGPVVMKQVVAVDRKAYLMIMNEISIQDYVAKELNLAPKIIRIEYGYETVKGDSPRSVYGVINIYQERMNTTLLKFIEALISARPFAMHTVFVIIRTLLRRVAEAAVLLCQENGTKILHGDLGPANVLLDIEMPTAKACAIHMTTAVQTCRIFIIDYGYSAQYNKDFGVRVSPKFSSLRYYHRFPVWYDRAFFLFTTVGLCANRLSMPVADVLRRLTPDWISSEVFNEAVKTYATKDKWQWHEMWEEYRKQYQLLPEKLVYDTVNMDVDSVIIEQEHATDPGGVVEKFHTTVSSNYGGFEKQLPHVVDFSGNPFWSKR